MTILNYFEQCKDGKIDINLFYTFLLQILIYNNIFYEQIHLIKEEIEEREYACLMMINKKQHWEYMWQIPFKSEEDPERIKYIKSLPKGIYKSFIEIKDNLKKLCLNYHLLENFLCLLKDIKLMNDLNNKNYIGNKINIKKYLEDNLSKYFQKNFKKNIGIDRFSITIREFIDTNLKSIYRDLFSPEITSIIGRDLSRKRYGRLVEGENYYKVQKNNYSVRSYDLQNISIISDIISNMITYFKLQIYTKIHSKEYLMYYRIFLIEYIPKKSEKFDVPTDIIRYIHEFIGPVETETIFNDLDSNKFNCANNYFLRNSLCE